MELLFMISSGEKTAPDKVDLKIICHGKSKTRAIRAEKKALDINLRPPSGALNEVDKQKDKIRTYKIAAKISITLDIFRTVVICSMVIPECVLFCSP